MFGRQRGTGGRIILASFILNFSNNSNIVNIDCDIINISTSNNSNLTTSVSNYKVLYNDIYNVIDMATFTPWVQKAEMVQLSSSLHLHARKRVSTIDVLVMIPEAGQL